MKNKNYDLVSFANAMINDELTDLQLIHFYRQKFFGATRHRTPKKSAKNAPKADLAIPSNDRRKSIIWSVNKQILAEKSDPRYLVVYKLLLKKNVAIRDACLAAGVSQSNFKRDCILKKCWRFERFDVQIIEGQSIDKMRRNAAYAGIKLPTVSLINRIVNEGGQWLSRGHLLGVIKHVGILKKLDC